VIYGFVPDVGTPPTMSGLWLSELYRRPCADHSILL
jgi:hypothetical protein